jgi:hypothetical protein
MVAVTMLKDMPEFGNRNAVICRIVTLVSRIFVE